jgi:KDO2-lipid IV(A) lauroyltransferase
MYGLASDQSPKLNRVYWDSFMGIEVPVHTGAEMLQKIRFECAFVKVKKLKRGILRSYFYSTDNPRSIPDFGITSIFFTRSRKQIIEAPEYYFWTHKKRNTRNSVQLRCLIIN